MTAPTGGQRKPVVLLRPVPGDTVIHRLWAGTKLLAVAGIGVLLTFYPGWVPIAFVAVLILVTARLAHIPRGVLPSIPFVIWILLVIGGALAALAGGSPLIDIGSMQVGLGGLLNYLRDHHIVDRAVGSGRAGVMDHERRRRRPCGGDAGPPAAPDPCPGPRLGGDDCLGAAGFPDADRRVPHVVCGASAAPRRTGRDVSGPAQAAGRPIWSICWPRRSPWRCAAAMRWAMPSPPRGGAGQISAAPSRPRRRDWIAFAVLVLVCGSALALELTVLPTSLPRR